MRRRVFMAGVAGSALLAAGTSIARAQVFTVAEFVGNEAHLPASPAELAARLVTIQGGMEKSWSGRDSSRAGADRARRHAGPALPAQRRPEPRRRRRPGPFRDEGKAIYSQIAHAPDDRRQDPTIAQFMDSLRLAG